MATVLEQTDEITLTSSAAAAVIDLTKTKNLLDYSLRVFIQGGGCSGYQYGMALDNRVRDTDLVFEQHGLKILIDEVSIQYMKGTTIDYVEDETGSGFKIDNPNPLSTCGCGQGATAEEGEGSSCGCGGGGCH
jgi:iron-sulfur cluster assembly accessory protein